MEACKEPCRQDLFLGFEMEYPETGSPEFGQYMGSTITIAYFTCLHCFGEQNTCRERCYVNVGCPRSCALCDEVFTTCWLHCVH